jgi:hypothetical protein
MIEPGLLRVFRGYAFLRLVLGILVLLGQFVTPERVFSAGISQDGGLFSRFEVVAPDNLLVNLGVLCLMLLRLGFLYSAG